MKKLVYLLLIISFILVTSGCSKNNEAAKDPDKLPNPVEDPGGYIPGMVDLNEKMKNDIKNATDKENEKLQKTLEESSP